MKKRMLIRAFKAWEAQIWEPLVAPRELLDANHSHGVVEIQAIRDSRQMRVYNSFGRASGWDAPGNLLGSWADDALARLMSQIEATPSLSTLDITDTRVTLAGLQRAYEACQSDSLTKVVVAKCWAIQRNRGWSALRKRIKTQGVGVKIDFILSVVVRGQDGGSVYSKINSHKPLKALMDVYTQRQERRPGEYRFIFDGNRIVETQRPIDLMMEDNDVIDAMLEQVGD